jgi:hypothetical protein
MAKLYLATECYPITVFPHVCARAWSNIVDAVISGRNLPLPPRGHGAPDPEIEMVLFGPLWCSFTPPRAFDAMTPDRA